MDRIYMDNAATTPLSETALNAMLPLLKENFGNASAVYGTGRDARKVLESARRQVASLIGAKPNEIYFTSGGTESDNWALKGVAFANQDKGKHIITTVIEHHAVLHSCEWLEKNGYEVTYLPVDHAGRVAPSDVEKAIRPDTILISVMTANNEIGTIQDIAAVGAIAKAHNILFHTDAVQAMGVMDVNVDRFSCDLLSMSAHKFHGPKGVGVLYVRTGTKLDNLIHGGAQERGKRGSTENVAGAAGLAAALQEACDHREVNHQKIRSLSALLKDGLLSVEGASLNGDPVDRLPGNVNISITGVEGEAMLLRLDLMGIAASAGSACTSGSLDPSHVLKAIGLTDAQASGSIRFSLSADNTEDEVQEVIQAVKKITADLRKMRN